VDFVITEAVAIKVAKEDEEEYKRREREEWKKKHGELREHAG
jgi:L-rhamnose mutarotase